jgi:hypothetical protein
VRTSIWPFIGPFADDASFARCLRSNRGTGTGRGARPRWHGKRLSGRASVQIVEGEGDDPGIEWIGLQSGSSLRRTWLSPGNGSSGHSPAAYPHIAVRRLRRHRENRSGHTPAEVAWGSHESVVESRPAEPGASASLRECTLIVVCSVRLVASGLHLIARGGG